MDSTSSDSINMRLTADLLIKEVDNSVEMEADRCDSFRKMCEMMLTGSSIVSVALLTVAQPLFEYFGTNLGLRHGLLALYLLVILLLTASMILALLSMARFRYDALSGPETLLNDFDNLDCAFGDAERAIAHARAQETIYQGLKKKNNIMGKLLIASQVALIVALGSILIGGLVLLVSAAL